jgi:hypothetical protein
VIGIAEACVPDPDTILRDLLAGAIDDCEERVGRHVDPGPAFDTVGWAAACQLTGTIRDEASPR